MRPHSADIEPPPSEDVALQDRKQLWMRLKRNHSSAGSGLRCHDACHVSDIRADIDRLFTRIKKPPNSLADGQVVNSHLHQRSANFFRWINRKTQLPRWGGNAIAAVN